MLFDPRRLEFLRAVAHHRSFTLAAEALYTTQPAVSRQIAALEAETGVELITRAHRSVALSPAGAALLAHADRIVPAVDRAARELQIYAAPDGGAIRVGAIPSALAGLVADAISALRARRPRIQIHVEEAWSADLGRRVVLGELDAAIVSAEAAPPTVEAIDLQTEPFVALLPARGALARRRQLRLIDLATSPWILAPSPGGQATVLLACARAGFEPRVVGTAQWDAARRLIAAGLGVALAPASVAGRPGPGVSARPLLDCPTRQLVLIRTTRPSRPAVELDLEEVLTTLGASRGS